MGRNDVAARACGLLGLPACVVPFFPLLFGVDLGLGDTGEAAAGIVFALASVSTPIALLTSRAAFVALAAGRVSPLLAVLACAAFGLVAL